MLRKLGGLQVIEALKFLRESCDLQSWRGGIQIVETFGVVWSSFETFKTSKLAASSFNLKALLRLQASGL